MFPLTLLLIYRHAERGRMMGWAVLMLGKKTVGLEGGSR